MKQGLAKRNSGLDLLRIVSMWMIITLHFLGHGGALAEMQQFSFEYFAGWSLAGVCFSAVNCFILISGFFLVESRFSIKHLWTFVATVHFYSVTIYTAMWTAGLLQFTPAGFGFSLFPLLTSQYWFATQYFILYALTPLLNIAIKSMTKQQMRAGIITLLLVFSIWPDMKAFQYGSFQGRGFDVTWFGCLYFIGAYFRLFYHEYDFGKMRTKLLLLFLLATAALPSTKFIAALAANLTGISLLNKAGSIFYLYHSVPTTISSVTLFLLFSTIKLRPPWLIKATTISAPLVFAVYLIHDNPNFRSFLWERIDAASHVGTPMFFLWSFTTIAFIFFTCLLIEFFRSWLYREIEQKTHIGDRIVVATTRLISRVQNNFVGTDSKAPKEHSDTQRVL